MNSIFARILGFTLIIAAVVGLIFSGWALVRIWTIKVSFTEDILSTVELANDTLEATSEGLIIAEASLQKAKVDVVSLQYTLEATSRAIKSTNPLFLELSELLDNDLPTAIQATRASLDTAQSSAELIENFLRTITNLPLLPVEPYNPAVPLHQSLGSVSESLERIPQSLADMEKTLSSSRGNLALIQAEFNIMARHVQQINESITDANTVVVEYQEVVRKLQERTTRFENKIPRWINNVAWFLTFALVWLGITQAGLLVYGIQLLSSPYQVERIEEVVVEREIVQEKTEEDGE